jgi:hypothetical protein
MHTIHVGNSFFSSSFFLSFPKWQAHMLPLPHNAIGVSQLPRHQGLLASPLKHVRANYPNDSHAYSFYSTGVGNSSKITPH